MTGKIINGEMVLDCGCRLRQDKDQNFRGKLCDKHSEGLVFGSPVSRN